MQAPYIIVTGAAGFIGSEMARHLNSLGYEELILVDDFGREDKRANWESIAFAHVVERYNLSFWLNEHQPEVAAIIHLGARTDTTEFNYAIHEELNVEYSQMLWQYCTEKQIPFIYASSAATYGAGELGYDDNHELSFLLKPLNPYGISKNEFDKWALAQTDGQREDTQDEDGWVRDKGSHTPDPVGAPPFWAGLKFFNVYGPHEYHKGRMASVIWHAFNQIKKEGQVKLFKSHRPDFEHGQQLRDFIYVKDVVNVIAWMLEQTTAKRQQTTEDGGCQSSVVSGLYNLGTGQARSFYDLAAATFRGLDIEPNIVFIDMPEDIRDKYQYFTEANMDKLRKAGYSEPFTSLEEGVDDYVRHYLRKL
ncbi:ADP-glyceromanno-heptose 6-epimerase [Phnomibacter sp. MR]|uniref:ADP-glyceromanno-heptose 6-epimerase n=1 Tax=Phnomibacter sp. MR TaxID=3042318 RepID=UPI003A800F1D